eukprot:1158306-Pelagomonas_calceolata.AAC.10
MNCTPPRGGSCVAAAAPTRPAHHMQFAHKPLQEAEVRRLQQQRAKKCTPRALRPLAHEAEVRRLQQQRAKRTTAADYGLEEEDEEDEESSSEGEEEEEREGGKEAEDTLEQAAKQVCVRREEQGQRGCGNAEQQHASSNQRCCTAHWCGTRIGVAVQSRAGSASSAPGLSCWSVQRKVLLIQVPCLDPSQHRSRRSSIASQAETAHMHEPPDSFVSQVHILTCYVYASHTHSYIQAHTQAAAKDASKKSSAKKAQPEQQQGQQAAGCSESQVHVFHAHAAAQPNGVSSLHLHCCTVVHQVFICAVLQVLIRTVASRVEPPSQSVQDDSGCMAVSSNAASYWPPALLHCACGV